MSNGIKFVFLLSVILIAMFSLTFAQDLPFNAEVIVDTARMRWGPGPAYTVQHYANLGHILTVLEADTESDPPWTWYRARTPSGVESWIRGDLLRRATGAAAQVEQPTGTYPVVENNLCNTDIYRRCQDGTDHDLWQSGYWANNRYNHWESGGWDLDIVYHNNPCKSNRLCTTRAQWDAGLIEAQNFAASLTPQASQTPVYIRVTREVGVREVWEASATVGLFGERTNNTAPLYTPPKGLYPAAGTRWGEFILNSESIRVDCYFWHNAHGENVKSGRFGVNLSRLLERTDEERPNAEDIKASQVNCVSGNIQEAQVVARQWKITVTRSYSGRSQIGGISWKLEATYGLEPESETDTACGSTCIKVMNTDANSALYNYIRSPLPTPDPEGTARTPRPTLTAATPTAGPFAAGTCTLRTSTSGEKPREITRYEHTCKTPTTGTLQHTMTFHYTRNETVGFAPQPTEAS